MPENESETEAKPIQTDLKENEEAVKLVENLTDEMQLEKDAEVKKAADERMKSIMAELPYITRDDMAKEIGALRREFGDLKTLLLKAKAQGKANIVKEEEDKMAELKKIYGEDNLKGLLDNPR